MAEHSQSYPDIEAVPMDRVIERAIRAFCRKSPGFPDLSLTAMAKDIADAVSRAMPSVAQAPAYPGSTEAGEVCEGCGKLLICRHCGKFRSASVAQAPMKRQYFYRVTGCKAYNSTSPDCICWHDEGTGPYAREPEALNWRTVPSLPSTQVPAQASLKDEMLAFFLAFFEEYPEGSKIHLTDMEALERARAKVAALSLPSTDPRCTCAAIVNPNIPHARSCPLYSTDETGAA